MERGEIWWTSLPPPAGSGPGYRRPVLVVQSDSFNRSGVKTVIVAVVTSNLRLREAPGNVLLSKIESGLPKASVVNVSQLVTVDRTLLTERVSRLKPAAVEAVNKGIRLVLGLAASL